MTLPGLHNKRDARTFHVRTCSHIHASVHAPDYSTRCRLEVTVILVIHFKHRTVLLGEK